MRINKHRAKLSNKLFKSRRLWKTIRKFIGIITIKIMKLVVSAYKRRGQHGQRNDTVDLDF